MASKLVTELMDEHKLLAATLEEAKKLGIISPAGQQKLLGAKSALLAHLKKEEQQLYPKLHAAGKKDPKLQSTLDFFAKDMEGVSKAALAFFEKYSGGDLKGKEMEFAKDYGSLIGALSTRIHNEETKLYVAFDTLPA